jgi:hypothetical protein
MQNNVEKVHQNGRKLRENVHAIEGRFQTGGLVIDMQTPTNPTPKSLVFLEQLPPSSLDILERAWCIAQHGSSLRDLDYLAAHHGVPEHLSVAGPPI